MNIDLVIRILLLILGIFAVFYLYANILKQVVKESAYQIWLAAGILFLVSLFNVLSPEFIFIIHSSYVISYFKTFFYLLWWLSLSYFVGKAIEFWVWDGFFVNKGIAISKILRDFVTIILVLLTITAILAFVFDKSVIGIFTASGVMAIILGYSAQATLSDIFAGLGLNTAKDFVEGDWIRVDDKQALTGKVLDINWRFVKLITKENNYLTIPNSLMSKLPIINLSRPEKKRGIVLNVQMQTDISPEKIKTMLTSAAIQSTKVHQNPVPKAELLQFKGGDCQYQLFYFTSETFETAVNDDILSIFWYSMKRESAKQLTESAKADERQTLENHCKLSQEQIENFLKATDLFHVLTDIELSMLAEHAVCHSYGPPERILNQGQANTSLFMIYSGTVKVFLTPSSAKPIFVTQLTEGQYFGEMSLLTGEACTASIVINTESIIIEIDHDNIAALFNKKPELMEKMSEVVVKRKNINEDLKLSSAKSKKDSSRTLINRMVNKMKLFFKHDD